jgi:hypothetical protein
MKFNNIPMVKKSRLFVRSFFLPHGGTGGGAVARSPLYAGRFDGRPALFVYDWYNPIAVEMRTYSGLHPTWEDWPTWLIPREVDETARAWRDLVIEELVGLGYTNTHAGWTMVIGASRHECDIVMKIEKKEA